MTHIDTDGVELGATGGDPYRIPSPMSALTAAQYELRKVDTATIKGNKLKRFYEQQNALIDMLVEGLGKAGGAAEEGEEEGLVGVEEGKEGGDAKKDLPADKERVSTFTHDVALASRPHRCGSPARHEPTHITLTL